MPETQNAAGQSQAAAQTQTQQTQTTPQQTTTPSPDAGQPAQQSQTEGQQNDAGQKPAEGDLLFAKKPDEPEAQKQDGDKKDENQQDAEVVYDLKLPDGATVVPEMLEGVKDFAKANNLKPEEAQKIVDLGVKFQQNQLAQWETTKSGWRDEVRSDPVLGGHNLDKSVKAAEEVVARFGGNEKEIIEMQEDLVLLGLGNKKSFIRFCNNIAKATKDDSMDGKPSGGGSQEKSLASRMWPNMPTENR